MKNMKLTRASSYALQAIAFIASLKRDHPTPSHFIAQSRRIPERFLLKVLKPLVSARILNSIKGPNGGYRLARAASEISILDVVEAVDGPIRGLIPLNNDGTDDGDNAITKKLEQACNHASEQVRKTLAKIRISDLAN